MTTLVNVYRDAVLMSSRHFKTIHDELYGRGERFFEHGSWIHGGPDVYDEVLRIPLMMKGKNIRSGIYGHRIQLLDIFPTIMDWLGDEPASTLHGRSLLKDLDDMSMTPQTSKPWEHRTIYADGMGRQVHYALIRDDIKIILRGEHVEVYHLARDPGEMTNLASRQEFQEMIAEARAFQESFEKNTEKLVREMSAEEKERLRSLGYLR
ncbi:MAG: hypothetical protein SCM96_05435 [Acidobacteriota bacterium]|nr:hypothetical protein [Acidobacteriota bacterium]